MPKSKWAWKIVEWEIRAREKAIIARVKVKVEVKVKVKVKVCLEKVVKNIIAKNKESLRSKKESLYRVNSLATRRNKSSIALKNRKNQNNQARATKRE